MSTEKREARGRGRKTRVPGVLQRSLDSSTAARQWQLSRSIAPLTSRSGNNVPK